MRRPMSRWSSGSLSGRPEEAGLLGLSPMGLSLLFFGVPCLLEALAEAGMEEPGG